MLSWGEKQERRFKTEKKVLHLTLICPLESDGEWERTEIFIRLKANYNFDWFYTADSSNYYCSGDTITYCCNKNASSR